MKALIFAAGLGTRLRPITDTMPKALVKVGGVPMLERVLLKLKAAGISDFVINAHHFAEQIIEFVQTHDSFGCHVDISWEKDAPLETGGGIKRAQSLLSGDRFIVHNADILSDVDISWFQSQDSKDAMATLLVTDAQADRYLLFDDDMCLVGWTNVRTGEVKSPHKDFDPSKYRRLSFCGIHIISDEVFPLMQDWPEAFSIVDFYLSIAATHKIKAAYCPDLKMIDIGSVEKLAEAQSWQD